MYFKKELELIFHIFTEKSSLHVAGREHEQNGRVVVVDQHNGSVRDTLYLERKIIVLYAPFHHASSPHLNSSRPVLSQPSSASQFTGGCGMTVCVSWRRRRARATTRLSEGAVKGLISVVQEGVVGGMVWVVMNDCLADKLRDATSLVRSQYEVYM